MRRTILILSALAITLLNCSGGNNLAGGTTETGNPRVACIMGCIVDSTWKGVKGADVRITPSRYNPLGDTGAYANLSTLTDTNGNFSIHAPNAGLYTLLARVSSGSSGRLLFNLYLDSAETLFISKVRTQPSRRMVVVLTDTSDYTGRSLYLPGTLISAAVNPTSRTTILDSIFAPDITLALYDTVQKRTLGRINYLPVGDTITLTRSNFSSGGSSSASVSASARTFNIP